MPTVVHFLNVSPGDCSIILHPSTNVTMIDVCGAKPVGRDRKDEVIARAKAASETNPNKFNQASYPDNPIAYLRDLGRSSIFRFILTHPDMDHMHGLKALFDAVTVTNFWDIKNNKEFPKDPLGMYSDDDSGLYKKLRAGTGSSKRLEFYAGASSVYFNQDASGGSGDGLFILAPTKELVKAANESGDYNDASYVILLRAGDFRMIFAGDSHDATWEYILKTYPTEVRNVDVLVAPHHGRDSDRSYDFLDTLRPTITLFGYAPAEHTAYDKWDRRGLAYITSDNAGTIGVIFDENEFHVIVRHEPFASKYGSSSPIDTPLGRFHWILTSKTQDAKMVDEVVKALMRR